MKNIDRNVAMQKLEVFKEHDLIKVVTGIRRCGKSTLLKMFARKIKKDGVSSNRIQEYNLEDFKLSKITDDELYSRITKKLVPNKTNYIFIDEPQNIEGFEKLLDGIFVLKNVDLYVTGSNAKMLSSDLATLLTGRYVEISLTPFSFAEYLEGLEIAKDEKHFNYQKVFIDYQNGTSLPAGIKLYKTGKGGAFDYIKSLYRTILEKDIYKRYDVRDKTSFENIFKYLLSNIGSQVSANSIANYLKSNGKKIHNTTVERYLDYFCETFLLYRIERFDIRGKKQLESLEKYYVADLGFRAALIGKNLGVDRGHLLENTVYFELLRRYEQVFLGKIFNGEVDFVARDKDARLSYFQVAYHAEERSTLDRELKPLLAIKDNFPKVLLTMDEEEGFLDGIEKVNVVSWLRQLYAKIEK